VYDFAAVVSFLRNPLALLVTSADALLENLYDFEIFFKAIQD
jgi:hypothetical protein